MGKDNRILCWGDQGDGTYRNPVLFADFSDPDVIRVGSDFYLIASDFNYMGTQVLHSKDLVNWEIIGQVFDSLKISPLFDQMQKYSRGFWAPSLRYHNGRYYIYVCTPEEGLFMWHAEHPRGPWSDTFCVKEVDRWEDPCPFWDDNGNAYLVHSRLGAGPLILHRMTSDGTRLLDDGREIYYGKGAEGPKMFKRNGWYYISLPENGVALGVQTIIRSRNVYGPYERKVVLPETNPHQGGMVEFENGEGWFIGFKYMEHLGRVCHLVPYSWQDDDWPKFAEGNVYSMMSWEKPNVGAVYPVSRPEVSDEFNEPVLNPIWQWNHNPVHEKWSLTERPGFLRLKSTPAPNHELARNTLTQKIWDTCGIIDVKLNVEGISDGQKSGFTFINAKEMGWVGVEQKGSSRKISYGSFYEAGGFGPEIKGDCVWLRTEYVDESCRFYYSLDGKKYNSVPVKFRMKFAGWKACRMGLYSFGSESGHADFDYFRFVYGPTLQMCRQV